MLHRFLLALPVMAGCAAGAAKAQEAAPPPAVAAAPVPGPPSLLPPPAVPDAATLAALPALDLARGYLAAVTALPLASQAAEAQGVLRLGIDGQAYTVNSTNAAQFIPFLQARVDAFGAAIAARNSPHIDGHYGLAAGIGCAGEKFDPRVLFSPGKGNDGKLMPVSNAAEIVTTGPETDLLVTLSQNRQTIGIALKGTEVENAVVFADVLSMGYELYGTISGNSIQLRFDPDEVKNALGAQAGTAADWQRLAACVFTLTKK